MAIKESDSDAMYLNLAHIYDNQKKYPLAEKYYLMAVEANDE